MDGMFETKGTSYSTDSDKTAARLGEAVGALPASGWENLRCRGVNGEQIIVIDKQSGPTPPSFPRYEFKRSDLKRPKFYLALLLFGILIVLYWFLLKQSLNEVKQRTIDTDSAFTLEEMSTDQRLIRVEVRVMSVDLIKNKVDTHISFYPSQALGKNHARLNAPVFAYLGYFQQSYKPNDTMSPVQVTFPILSGSTSYYPFDSFYTEIAVEFTNLKTDDKIPAQVSLKASIPSLMFSIIKSTTDGNQQEQHTTSDNTNTSSDEDAVKYKFRLLIERPLTVSIFSMFVVALMWCLTLVLLAVSINLAFVSRIRPSVSYLGVGSSLLFALPGLRGTQPGIPPIGIIIDAVGFFWNMSLIAICSILNILVWVKRRHTDHTIG